MASSHSKGSPHKSKCLFDKAADKDLGESDQHKMETRLLADQIEW